MRDVRGRARVARGRPAPLRAGRGRGGSHARAPAEGSLLSRSARHTEASTPPFANTHPRNTGVVASSGHIAPRATSARRRVKRSHLPQVVMWAPRRSEGCRTWLTWIAGTHFRAAQTESASRHIPAASLGFDAHALTCFAPSSVTSRDARATRRTPNVMRPLALALCVALAASAASAQELDVDAREVRPRPRRPALATDAHETGVESKLAGFFFRPLERKRGPRLTPPPPPPPRPPADSPAPGGEETVRERPDGRPDGPPVRILVSRRLPRRRVRRLVRPPRARRISRGRRRRRAPLHPRRRRVPGSARGLPLDALFAPFGTPTYATSPDGARELSLRPPRTSSAASTSSRPRAAP